MRISLRWLIGAVFIFGSAQSFGMMVTQMNLDEMATNAERIVRGMIVHVESGTVFAGGGELPVIKYTVQVSEVLKGKVKKDQVTNTRNMKIVMIGQLKPSQSGRGGVVNFSGMQEGLKLKLDSEYLLLLTKPSRIGLSTTVGIGQGAFEFLGDGTVENEAKNAGLFKGMSDSRDRRPLSNTKPSSNSAKQNNALAMQNNGAAATDLSSVTNGEGGVRLTYDELKQHIVTLLNKRVVK